MTLPDETLPQIGETRGGKQKRAIKRTAAADAYYTRGIRFFRVEKPAQKQQQAQQHRSRGSTSPARYLKDNNSRERPSRLLSE